MVFELVIMLVVLALGFVFGRIWDDLARDFGGTSFSGATLLFDSTVVGGGLASQSQAG